MAERYEHMVEGPMTGSNGEFAVMDAVTPSLSAYVPEHIRTGLPSGYGDGTFSADSGYDRIGDARFTEAKFSGDKYFVPTNVSDKDGPKADDILMNITQENYRDYLEYYMPKEIELINKAKTDTSIIDSAVANANQAGVLAQGISNRTQSRYGTALTAAQRQQTDLATQRGLTLGGIQQVSNARVAQKDSNRALMSDLINIGQNLNKSSMQQLGVAAKNQIDRENAQEMIEYQHKMNMMSMGVSLIAGGLPGMGGGQGGGGFFSF